MKGIHRFAASCLAVLALAAGCSRDERVKVQDPIPAEWPRPHFDTATIVIGGHPLTVELAESAEQRRYGYMFVSEPPADDRGMLFVYREPMQLNFWMRNTRIELDLIYVSDDGRVLNVHRRMVPFKEQTNYQSLEPCRMAVEVRGGWCEDHGVWVGAKVEIPDAVRARPADPHIVLENIPSLVHG